MKRFFIINVLCGILACTLFLANPVYGQFTWPAVNDELPEGWKHQDIGSFTPPSRFAYVAETDSWYFDVYGNNVWGGTEEFHFAYFETEADKQVVCQVSYALLEHAYGKAFIMIRAGLNPLDPWGYMENRKADICFNYRATYNGACVTPYTYAHQNGLQAPRWLKYIRQGSFITGYVRDTEDIPWHRMGAPMKLALKGTCYMGVGVCGHSRRARVIFQNVVVEDIDVPYAIDYPTDDQALEKGASVKIDVTKTFGHYGDDYFTITPTVSDPSVLRAVYSEEPAPEGDVEQYYRYITITGLSDGVSAVNLNFSYNGFVFNDEFVVDVTDPDVAPQEFMSNQAPIAPWKFSEVVEKVYTQDMSKNNNHRVIAYQPTTPLRGDDDPITIPGSFYAVEYDWGGTGLSFRDNDAGVGSAGAYAKYRPQRSSYGDYNPNMGENSYGPYINGTSNNDWLRYTIKAEQSGYYRVGLDIGRGNTATFQFFLDGSPISPRTTLPKNGWSLTPTTVLADAVFIEEGTHTLDYYMWAANQDLGKMYFTLDRAQDQPDAGYVHPGTDAMPVVETSPYTGTAFPVPGPSWLAWQYDLGGMYNAYFDFSTNNEGGGMGRNEGVDLGGGGNIGWTNAGEWTVYSIDVQDDGLYILQAEIAAGGNEAKFNFEIDNVRASNTLGTPKSSWSNWVWVRSDPIFLSQGLHRLKLVQHKGGFDIRGIGVMQTSNALQYEGSVEEKLILQTDVSSAAGLLSKAPFLYQQSVNTRGRLEMDVKVDSLANTGKGSFAGFMLRNGNSGSDNFLSYAVGAYEGLRLNYQWSNSSPVVSVDVPDVNLPVYLKLRTEPIDGNPTLQAYYSYDNEVWTSVLPDPLLINFLNPTVNAGFATNGGGNVSSKRFGRAVATGLTLQQQSSYQPLPDQMPEAAPLAFGPNPWNAASGAATATFGLVTPGRVILSVHNYYGVLINTVVDEYRQPGNYTVALTAAQMGNNPSGTYLIKLVTPDSYEYIRFIYNK